MNSSTPATASGDGQRQVVALGAMVLAVAAALALGGMVRQGGEAATASWAAAVEAGADHVAPAELAAEIMAGRGGLLLVDVRPADEYAAFHLPGAVNLSLPQLLGQEGAPLLAGSPSVVLYSNGPAHPAQAWVELQRRGLEGVRVLDGGLAEFTAEVLTPPSLRGPVDEAESRRSMASFALRRAFFGLDGPPRSAATWATDPAELTAPTMVSGRWLEQRLGRVAVVDVREQDSDYLALHLPTAVHLPVASLRSKHGDRELMLLDAAALAARFGALGIDATTPVVLCAQDKLQDATLAALAFRRVGHTALAILEGGIQRWAFERRPLVADVPVVSAKHYEPRPGADDFTVTTDEVAALVAAGTATVLDVRPPEFFRGERSTEARPGHIPGARNRPFQRDLLPAADGVYVRARADLLREYAQLGLDPDKPVVVQCRTGHTASESFFVLRHLLGYQHVKWYNGSWTEWAERKDLPATTGDGQ